MSARANWRAWAWGVALGSAPLHGQPAPDAIVVGAGIAGLSAAWEMAQGGANVVVVDMASVFGGHSVMAEGLLSIVDTPTQAAQGLRDNAELAYNDFVAWGEDPNPAWLRYYVDHSRREIYDWVTSFGVTFAGLLSYPGNTVERTHRTAGRGLALVSPIFRACLGSPNIRFVWNTRVERVVTDAGRVTGINAVNLRTGEPLELRARAIVLATGGFQSNLELVRQAWPAGQPFPDHFLIGSGINSQGSGLTIAQQAGGAVSRLDHQWNYTTGLPDPRFPGERRGLNARNDDAIWVNADGRRFIAEKTSSKFAMNLLLRQKGQTYWAIFDATTKGTFWISGSDWIQFSAIEKWIFSNPDLVKSAPTITELAQKAGLPAGPLQKTVERHNEMVRQGVDEEFGRYGPGKTFQPRKIATPPFYAVQFYPITRKSMGGVVIDIAARVQDAEGRPIPGLFAAGEVTGLAGINGKAGLEGTFLGPSIVTGRVAGRSILAELGRPAPAGRVASVPPKATVTPDPLASTQLCLSCHDLPKLIQEPRAGFWHFEKVHRAVVANQFDCGKCHADLTATFVPEKHRTNRLAQVENCATCHKGVDR